MIANKDYSGFNIFQLIGIKNGEVFSNCNFSQLEETDILTGVTGLKFINCLLENINVPPDAEVIRLFKNYSWTDISKIGSVRDGEIFEKCNFKQWELTDVLTGVTGLIFRDHCNLVNVNLPKDAITEKGCNTTKKDYCSHLHPDFGLPECETECRHEELTKRDRIYLDGILIKTIYYYKDITL